MPRVQALRMGFYGTRLRRPGDIFEMTEDELGIPKGKKEPKRNQYNEIAKATWVELEGEAQGKVLGEGENEPTAPTGPVQHTPDDDVI